MVSTLSPPAVVCILHRDYRYKSAATQFSHDAGLAQIPYTAPLGIEPALHLIVGIKALNVLAMGLGLQDKCLNKIKEM
jgi:hypothetical protein